MWLTFFFFDCSRNLTRTLGNFFWLVVASRSAHHLFLSFYIIPDRTFTSVLAYCKPADEYISIETIGASSCFVIIDNWEWVSDCWVVTGCKSLFILTGGSSYRHLGWNMPRTSLLSRSDLTVYLFIYLKYSSRYSGSRGASSASLSSSELSSEVNAWSFWWRSKSLYF